MFLNIFERFQTFLNVFFLPILPKPYKLTHQTLFLPPKTNIPPKNPPKTLKFYKLSPSITVNPDELPRCRTAFAVNA